MSEETMARNQGMSLIELLVAVAVLGIAMIGITALMSFSAKYFASSSKEVEIQSELQTTFALVSNMVVDANVSITYSSGRYIIQNDAATYVVELSGTKLYAVALKPSDPVGSPVDDAGTNLIADHITAFSINLNHLSSGYVTLHMKAEYKGREAEMARNVFLRNRYAFS
ncbi:MAG: type II secretion system protein [Lachnospiraceae bacterium]|nr:type II secretion system protein [Lachnospiraceae bacterium]